MEFAEEILLWNVKQIKIQYFKKTTSSLFTGKL